MADAKFEGVTHTQVGALNCEDQLRVRGVKVLPVDGQLVGEMVLYSFSTALSQEPSGLDSPIKVEFGTPQYSNGDIILHPDGDIECVTPGLYLTLVDLEIGRTSNNGEALIFGRNTRNGVQVGQSKFASIDAVKFNLPFQFTVPSRLSVGDVSTVEIYRDSQGVDDGGLYLRDTSLVNWNDTATAQITIWKIIEETD